VTLHRGLTIRGRTIDPEGKPLTATKVYCGYRGARPGPDGRFELCGVGLAGGRVGFSDYAPDRPLTVPPHDAESLVELGDIVLRPGPRGSDGPRIRGTIRGPEGKPLSRHSLEATGPLGTGFRGFVESDAKGRFELQLRSPGSCRIRSSLEVHGGTIEIDEPIDPSNGPIHLRFPSRGLTWLRLTGERPVGVELIVDGVHVGSATYLDRALPLLLPAGDHHLRVLPVGRPAADLDIEVDPEAPARTVRVRLLR
jgi:hypothetical protein